MSGSARQSDTGSAYYALSETHISGLLMNTRDGCRLPWLSHFLLGIDQIFFYPRVMIFLALPPSFLGMQWTASLCWSLGDPYSSTLYPIFTLVLPLVASMCTLLLVLHMLYNSLCLAADVSGEFYAHTFSHSCCQRSGRWHPCPSLTGESIELQKRPQL